MTTSVRSIDAAANGFARHRFLRALSASFVVGATFGILALAMMGTVQAVATGGLATAAVAPVGVILVVLIVLAPIVLGVALAGAVIDLLHRRIIGLVLFGLTLIGIVFVAGGLFLAGGTLAGFDMTTPNSPERLSWHEALVIGSFCLAGLLICYELLRAGWWQLTVGGDNFRAIRGWRPPLGRLFTSFRRYLGLPSFLSYVGKKRRVVTALYFAVAVLNLGILMVLMVPVTFAGAEANKAATSDLTVGSAAMIVLLLLNLFGAGAIVARAADKRATRLYQRVREWDARAPIVFLRSFDQDDNKLRVRGGDAFARWPAGVGASRTLDEILLEHGSPYGPVIAIGDPRDPTPPLGAARVFVPGEGAGWQDVVRGLAGASKAVVMCPNRGEGVRWELDLIAQAGGRLRTIFLASPDLDRDANLALFRQLVPDIPEIKAKQSPLAAFEQNGQWRVLTAKRASVEAYTAALNTALQALFGMKGEPLKAR